MTKQAVGLYVLIKHKAGQTRMRKSGLEIPTEMEDRFVLGEIISASTSIGKEEFGLEAGQQVLYDKHAGRQVRVEGEDYLMVTCRDVALIV
jgi:co-chaperonin GroES (HSP10)